MRSMRLESRAMPNGRCRMHGGTLPGARRQVAHRHRPASRRTTGAPVPPLAVRLQPLTYPPTFTR